jgi:hypothetical protein
MQQQQQQQQQQQSGCQNNYIHPFGDASYSSIVSGQEQLWVAMDIDMTDTMEMDVDMTGKESIWMATTKVSRLTIIMVVDVRHLCRFIEDPILPTMVVLIRVSVAARRKSSPHKPQASISGKQPSSFFLRPGDSSSQLPIEKTEKSQSRSNSSRTSNNNTSKILRKQNRRRNRGLIT